MGGLAGMTMLLPKAAERPPRENSSLRGGPCRDQAYINGCTQCLPACQHAAAVAGNDDVSGAAEKSPSKKMPAKVLQGLMLAVKMLLSTLLSNIADSGADAEQGHSSPMG